MCFGNPLLHATAKSTTAFAIAAPSLVSIIFANTTGTFSSIASITEYVPFSALATLT
jgi:hypothetical protein